MKKALDQFFKLFLAVSLVLTAQVSLGQTSDNQSIIPQSSLLDNKITNSDNSPHIRLELKEFDQTSEALKQAEKLIENSDSQKNTTVVSSDSIQFLQDLSQTKTIEKVNSKSTFFLFNNSFTRFAKKTGGYVKQSFQNDRIGFVIATYTTAIETVMWLHVGPMSTLATSANIVYTIASAMYFRLNKDKWTELTAGIKKPMQEFFNDTNTTSIKKNIAYDYFSNLALASVLSLIRVPLMSLDQIIDHGLTLGMFKMPILLSIVGTASFFTWSEHLGSINKSSHPIAKFVFTRSSELRTIILATFASTAALLNPVSFGIAPWITLTVVGTAGAIFYLKGSQINDWVEKSPLFRKLEFLVKYNSGSEVFMCKNLFATN